MPAGSGSVMPFASARVSSRAAEPPDNVAQAHPPTRPKPCKDAGGTPNADYGVERSQDLNGDGGEDWIADLRKRCKCEGVPNSALRQRRLHGADLFLGRRDTAWDVVFEDLVQELQIRQGRRQAHVVCDNVGRSLQQAHQPATTPIVWIRTPSCPCNSPPSRSPMQSHLVSARPLRDGHGRRE